MGAFGFFGQSREEREAGMDQIENAADDQEREQALKNYLAARPIGDVNRPAAFNAGFAAGIRFMIRKRQRR